MEPAKPFEKKSELSKKLSILPGNGVAAGPVKLPPLAGAAAAAAAPKANEKGGGGINLNETKNGAAYQVKKAFLFLTPLFLLIKSKF